MTTRQSLPDLMSDALARLGDHGRAAMALAAAQAAEERARSAARAAGLAAIRALAGRASWQMADDHYAQFTTWTVVSTSEWLDAFAAYAAGQGHTWEASRGDGGEILLRGSILPGEGVHRAAPLECDDGRTFGHVELAGWGRDVRLHVDTQSDRNLVAAGWLGLPLKGVRFRREHAPGVYLGHARCGHDYHPHGDAQSHRPRGCQ